MQVLLHNSKTGVSYAVPLKGLEKEQWAKVIRETGAKVD